MNTQVLIVESDENLGNTWRGFLERHGFDVALAQTQKQALDSLRFDICNVLIIDLMMPDSSSLAITDFASYKNPDISIIVVSASSFFSDGSIFEILPNARGFMNQPIEPDDLVAVVDHCSGY
ncbi:response regulator [Amylibacter sp. SFDW26]|uniref:response regulator n=1 Tax=Amylibacter sp. SFDW26 TaxID=2652722 RepID=UPI0012622B1A|nr:response regulator [Amylibacter sp. SFDW26]KAB7614742.1 response regulator [Amylibacter sp. SFDW26]